MFIDGRYTLNEIADENDPIIDNLNCTSCNSTLTTYSGDVRYMYYCFSTDVLAGYLTMLCMFIPGLLMSCFISIGFWKNSSRGYALLTIILTPVQMAIFPFLLLFVKVKIFNLKLIKILVKAVSK